MGITPLRRVYIGKEVTAGSQAAATHIMRTDAAWLEDKALVVHPKQPVGRMIPATRTYVPRKYGEITMVSDATYEELGYILNAALVGVEPVADAGTAYFATYPFPITAQATKYTYSIEAGDDQQEFEANYGLVRSFTLDWKAPGAGGEDGAWSYTAVWNTQAVAKDTFTAALSVTAIETILSPACYIDTNLATIGITEKTATLRSASFKWQENIPQWHAGGSTEYDSVLQNTWDNVPTLTLEYEFDAVGEAQYDAWLAGTQQAFRLKSLGTALSGGSTYANKTFILDFYGTPIGEPTWGSAGGNDTITLTYDNRYYDTASDLAGQIIIAHALSALP